MSKKLSLEERLSQAAKKNRRKSKKSHVSSAATLPNPDVESSPAGEQLALEGTSEIQSTPDASKPATAEQQLEGTDTDQTSPQLDQDEPNNDESKVPSTVGNNEESTLSSPLRGQLGETQKSQEQSKEQPAEIQRPELHHIKYDWLPQPVGENQKWTDALKVLDSKFGKLLDIEASKVPIDTQNLLKSKDELIDQLRKEGETLSKSEFKKSTRIKALESEVRDLEFVSSSLQEDLEKKDSECITLKKSLHSAQDQVSELNRTVVSLKKSVSDADNLRKTIKENDDRIVTLQTDLDNVNRTLKAERSRFEAEKAGLKSSTSSQISALESDLEKLRMELERKSTYADDGDGNGRGNRDLETTGEQYMALKEQLEATERNLQMTRDALNSNISKLEETLELNRIEIEKLNKEVERVTTVNTLLQKELESQKTKNQYLREDLARGKSTASLLKQSFQSLKDDYDLLEKKYNIQKSQLQANYKGDIVTAGEPSGENPAGQWLPPLGDDRISDLDFKEPDSKSDLEPSYIDTSTNGVEEDELLGNSALSLPVSAISNGLGSHISRSIQNQSGPTNLTETEATGGNSQIITRLGSEIRRLENELKSMTESYTKLSKEKEKANEEMLRLMNESDDLKATKEANAQLSKKVTELEHQLEVSLQLLGEKTETVEELENDVKDLKDMIRQQVQQMVELEQRK